MTYTANYTRLAGIVCLAGIVVFLAHDGGHEDMLKSVLAGLLALVLGNMDPAVRPQRATDPIPVTHEEPKS